MLKQFALVKEERGYLRLRVSFLHVKIMKVLDLHKNILQRVNECRC